MSDLTTKELAHRLGVSRRHAVELVSSRVIVGRQLASGAWLVDSDTVARYEVEIRRGRGRRLDTATAWGLLWILSGLDAPWLTPSTRSRLHARLRTSTPDALARAVASRTTAHRYQAANAAMAAEGLIATGRAVAGQLGVGLMDDNRAAIGYAPSSAAAYAATRFMLESPSGQHVIYDITLPVPFTGKCMPAAVIAADLALSTDTRERAGGLAALENLRIAWLADR